jgi:hypothetical protein
MNGATGRPVSNDEYIEVMRLLAALAVASDTHDIDACLSSYAPDGVLRVYGREWSNGDALRQAMEAAPQGLHLVGAPDVSSHENGLRARQNFLFVDRETREQRIGLYTDDIRRFDAQLKIVTRRVEFHRPGGLADRP